MSRTLSKFSLLFHEATTSVHFPKTLKRPRNNAGPASTIILIALCVEAQWPGGWGAGFGIVRFQVQALARKKKSRLRCVLGQGTLLPLSQSTQL